MPKLLRANLDTDETVVRPVMFDIIREIKEYTKLDHQDVAVFYPGTENKTFQPGSSIGKDSLENTLKGAFYNQVAIEIDEQYEHDRILETAVFRPDNLFIFRDDYLETSIRPVYSSMDVSINIRFRAMDKVTAIRWRDEMRATVSMGRMTHLHELTYSYFIPVGYLKILEEIHRLRERVAGYGQSWEKYFKDTVTEKATEVVNLAGKLPQWAIAETQGRVVGYFDFDGAPEQGSREDGGETWTIAVTYKFKYDKPVGCVMFYPLMVHNQLLGPEWRPKHGPYEIQEQQRVYSLSAGAFSKFESGRVVGKLMEQQGVFLPSFDEFIPSRIWGGTLRVITVMIAIDPKNPAHLMNLVTDLKPYALDPDIIGLLKVEAPYMTLPYTSIFNLSLYEGAGLMDDTWLAVDNELNVTAQKPLDYRSVYHIRLSILRDPTTLPPAAVLRLRKHCAAAVKIFDTIDPTLRRKNRLPVCMTGDWLPKVEYHKASDAINAAVITKGNGQNYTQANSAGGSAGMKTVASLLILAGPKGN